MKKQYSHYLIMIKPPTYHFLLVIILFISLQSLAQNTLEGVVLDRKTKEPLPFASVYIDKSQIGGITNSSGEFRIKVPYNHQLFLFVSFVGYKTARLKVDPARNIPIAIYMDEDEIVMEEKIISSSSDKEWQKSFKQFTKGFIGNGFGKRCEIENPWVLEFEKKKSQLVATSGEQVLTILNHALGYKINFLLEEFKMGGSLTSFHGLASFEEMTPSSPGEKEAWIENRNKTYNGSMRHFLKSLTKDSLMQNGFMVFKTEKPSDEGLNFANGSLPVARGEILSANTLDFSGFIDVLYVNELSGGTSQRSLLEMVKPSRILPNG